MRSQAISYRAGHGIKSFILTFGQNKRLDNQYPVQKSQRLSTTSSSFLLSGQKKPNPRKGHPTMTERLLHIKLNDRPFISAIHGAFTLRIIRMLCYDHLAFCSNSKPRELFSSQPVVISET
jgi:hypothetical protein